MQWRSNARSRQTSPDISSDAMEAIRLRLIAEPKHGTRAILDYSGPGTIIVQGGALEPPLVCAQCGALLVVGVARATLRQLVFRCKTCGACNET